MKKAILLLVALAFFLSPVLADEHTYTDSWGNTGFTVEQQTPDHVIINYSFAAFSVEEVEINGTSMQLILLPGTLLPNNEGSPDLPGTGRYVAVPAGASASFTVLESRTEILEGLDVAPAPRIPWDTDKGPVKYEKNPQIYQADALYPSQPVIMSELSKIRGVDVVMIGITPFQYNPVKKQLVITRDIRIRIDFTGGNGYFGEDRLRSRWWDPLLRNMLLNEASLPEVDYSHLYTDTKATGCEYLIISPNGPDFVQWADTIKLWRNRQGILTKVVTLAEMGGSSTSVIENYINNAYNTWDIPPAAMLFLGDYGTDASNSILSPVWDGYCISDNLFADVTGDDLPEIAHARITAQNASQLALMIGKFINYEQSPPVNPHYYDKPVTAMGWQTERWFQLCSEVVNGFWEYKLGKHPIRENKIYEGTPGTVWSSAQNTNVVVNYFGPNGLGYIPQTPAHLTDWGATAQRINNDINAGAFMLNHRDHGYEQGWGEPDYNTSHLTGLNNDDLVYVLSVNCLTGKFNISSECFAEAFHRHQKGALGLIAATEVSYSFVNDAYLWGLYDEMWPDFMPAYGTPGMDRILPAFGNVGGKYFLQQSAWPYNSGNKEVTYYLFHHHGDGFSTVYTEMPQNLAVVYNSVILENSTVFPVQADTGSLICLSVAGEIIGVAEGTGMPVNVSITGQPSSTLIDIVITKQNYYRHHGTVTVIAPGIPYVVQGGWQIQDNTGGNGNGLMDYAETIQLDFTMQNIGTVAASNVSVTLSSQNPHVTITDGQESYGNIPGLTPVTIQDAFEFDVSANIPDGEIVFFDVTATNGSTTWVSHFFIKAYAPALEIAGFEIADPSGNNNGRIEPGETADITIDIRNSGSSGAFNVMGALAANDPYLSVSTGTQPFGNLLPGDESTKVFTVTADPTSPDGHQVDLYLNMTADNNLTAVDSFLVIIGKYPALVLDLDPKHYSGPVIYSAFNDLEVYTDYTITFPEDLGLYKTLFICLGIKFNNYILSQDEGQKLKDFLENGGNIYMEGRVTWLEDPQTPVHPMFNITPTTLTWFQLQSILGIEGKFTHGLSFGYSGTTPYCNHSLEPVAPAYSIFQTQDPYHGCGVAFPNATYKTIGTTFEFGQLVDGTSPSTKSELLQLLMDFFDGIITGAEDYRNPQLDLSGSVAVNPNPASRQVHILYESAVESEASITITNLQGKEVKHLQVTNKPDGNMHTVVWDLTDDTGNRVPAGLYICTLKMTDGIRTGKIIVTQ